MSVKEELGVVIRTLEREVTYWKNAHEVEQGRVSMLMDALIDAKEALYYATPFTMGDTGCEAYSKAWRSITSILGYEVRSEK